MDLFSLDGKVALVTGAGSGLGRQRAGAVPRLSRVRLHDRPDPWSPMEAAWAPARILAVRRGWWLPGGHSRGVQIGVIMWLVAWVMPA